VVSFFLLACMPLLDEAQPEKRGGDQGPSETGTEPATATDTGTTDGGSDTDTGSGEPNYDGRYSGSLELELVYSWYGYESTTTCRGELEVEVDAGALPPVEGWGDCRLGQDWGSEQLELHLTGEHDGPHAAGELRLSAWGVDIWSTWEGSFDEQGRLTATFGGHEDWGGDAVAHEGSFSVER